MMSADNLFKIEATKTVVVLSIIGGFVILGWFAYLFLGTPYKNYQQAREKNRQTGSQLEEKIQELRHLQHLKVDYLKSVNYIENSKFLLSLDAAELISHLTKDSPVENFSLSFLEKRKKQSAQNGFAQYPFEIGFTGDFQTVEKYLFYQESSLPVSYIESIEIAPTKKKSSHFEVRLAGILYGVD